MKLNGRYITAILLTLVFVGCGSQDNKNKELITNTANIQPIQVEEFKTFYERFIKDESFQMSRIKLPLEGYFIEGDEKVKWTKDNIITQKGSVYDVDTTNFKVEIIKTDTTILTRIYKIDSEIDIQNKFELINDKWFLTYHLNIY